MKADEIESMTKRVARHPFLLGLNHSQLAFLTDCAMAVEYKAGEILLREGDFANRFYLIESGEVVLEAGKDQPIPIETLASGELLGWSWMFPPYIWQFTARATKPTKAIFFYGTILREYCERDHSLGYELFRRMSAVMIRRLQSARQKMLEAKTAQPNLA